MPRYLSDTRPEADAVWIELWRAAPGWRKIEIVEQLNRQMRALCLAGLRARYPNADDTELRRRLADLLLGPELAAKAYGSLPPGWSPTVLEKPPDFGVSDLLEDALAEAGLGAIPPST